MKDVPHTADALGIVLVGLLRGIVYGDRDATVWQSLLSLQARVRDYVAVVGLELVLDEAEGFAFLRQRPHSDEEPSLPRLIPRRQLGYWVSLLLALLRKRLAEFDAAGGESRLIVTRDALLESLRLFMPASTNEAKIVDRFDGYINRVVELGFLRSLEGRAETFEVRRILKTFVDAQWLQAFDDRLAEYREHLASVSSVAANAE